MRLTPIFIMGSPRNGTTWLSNMIGDYQCVTSTRHFLHWGNHESNIYRKKKFYGDLNNLEQYILFVEQFAVSDLFILANGSKEKLVKKRYRDFYEVYFDLMDDKTIKEGNLFWVTKLDPHFSRDKIEFNRFMKCLQERYDNPKFIFIERDIEHVIKSYVNFIPNKRSKGRVKIWGQSLVMMIKKVAYDYFFKSIVREHEGISFRYEELLKDELHIKERIESYIGIADRSVREQDYLKNSSFFKKDTFEFNPVEVFVLVNIIHPVLKAFKPLTVLLARLSRYKNAKPAYYRMMQYQYYKEDWMDEEKKRNLDRVVFLIEQYEEQKGGIA